MNQSLDNNRISPVRVFITNPWSAPTWAKALYFLTTILFSGIVSVAQNHTATGRVTDAGNNTPLAGVNIAVKGALQRAITDTSGEYSINVADPVSTLVFSMIGYTSQEVKVTGKTTINVQLSVDRLSLGEVVVVGYGTQKKSDVTGSVVRVTMGKTADLPNYSILQSLQGRVAGLNVGSPDRPGETPSITVRGTNSISAGTNPLIVVDGIIYNGSITDFNPNDIASVDVLKDASATAVYGSRAANGVLLVTTRMGSTEKPQFNFNTYHGIQTPDQLIRVLGGPVTCKR